MSDAKRAGHEAFMRDYPTATTAWGEAEDRNLWKYIPDLVARARAAAHLRRAQRAILTFGENQLTKLNPKGTR